MELTLPLKHSIGNIGLSREIVFFSEDFSVWVKLVFSLECFEIL